MTNEKASFRLSSDAKALAKMLDDVTVGEVVAYKAMSDEIGSDVQRESRGALQRARIIAMRERRAVFDVVRGVGLKRLDDAEIVDLSDKSRDSMRRIAKRTVKKIVCADYEKLTSDQQTKHNTSLSIMRALVEIASDKSARAIASKVSKTNCALSAEAVGLAAFN